MLLGLTFSRRDFNDSNRNAGNDRPDQVGQQDDWQRRVKNRRAIAAAVTTDGFPLHFRQSLDAVVQVYGVGFGQGEPRRVLAVFAVPGRKITPRPRPDGGPGLLYPVSIRLIAMDRGTGVVRQIDTTRVFLTRDTLRGDQHLTGLIELAVPPGSYQIRTLVTSPPDSTRAPAPGETGWTSPRPPATSGCRT